MLVAVVTCALAGCAPAGAGDDGPPLPGPEPYPEEVLELPPVTGEMHAVLDEARARWGDHPDFGQPEISLDRTLIVLRWHGPPPAELTALVEGRAHPDFDVRLDRTPFRDSELSEEAGRLVREHSGVVHTAWPRTGGDGVGLGIDPSVAGDDVVAALDRLGITSRFPLFPEASSPPVAIPAG
ncbi:hypothetical protein DQ244_07195 [Blastococcus sp. TBT05-19]|nr:hypothetical protein DQ244_07195 [Blastococcus sp. TBT05-19]